MNREEAENVLQPIMDRAYTKWPQDSHDFEDFLMVLDITERRVVAIGKLNQQVENGGFVQWRDNGYDHGKQFLIEALRTLRTDSARTVLALVQNALSVEISYRDRYGELVEIESAQDELDSLSDEFYKVNDQLLIELADFVSKEAA